MPEPGKESTGGDPSKADSPQKQADDRQHRSKTEGTNRDFDESGESRNQGHGHPREEREAS